MLQAQEVVIHMTKSFDGHNRCLALLSITQKLILQFTQALQRSLADAVYCSHA